MKVLLVASEVAPLIKFGGLGDVIGSLPKALEQLNVNIDVIVPFYPFAKLENSKVYKSIELQVPFDNENHTVEVFKTKLPGSNVDVLLLKNERFFNISKVNPVPPAQAGKQISEMEMYTFFSRAVVEYVKSQFNTYDVVHCNDWHTGLIVHLLEEELEPRPMTLFTVHNLLYQGISGVDIIREAGLVPGVHKILEWDIADGDLNMMQQGVAASDYVNTVSPTYAKEIMTEEFGKNLCDLVKAREGRVSGILNGIDYSQFPRSLSSGTSRNNDVDDGLKYKQEHKQIIQKELSLIEKDIPLFCFISRLDPNQKGLDILYSTVSHILKSGGQFVLLGSGDKTWEYKFKELETKPEFKGRISINISFDTALANRIYEGSDFIVIPSKYEPCGLNQMIGMWYGCLPIVHAVGGLKDSVNDGINGFTFEKYDSNSLNEAINKAINVYNSDHRKLVIEHALHTDFSWDKSAKLYKELYERMLA